MRSIPALIIVIIGIVAIIAVVGFVIASIAHNYSETETQVKADLENNSLPKLEQNMFILQLFSSNNYSHIEHQKQKLEKAGYNTIVTKTMKANVILYRLRLEGLYGKNEAQALGNEIKQKFPAIQDYWLDQIGTEESVSEHIAEQNLIEEQEDSPTENIQSNQVVQDQQTQPQQQTYKQPEQQTIQTTGKQYEVQLMASSNYAKIEEAKAALSRLGYVTKILNLQEGKKIVYRLRLKDQYSQDQGKALGDKIIRESSLITGYWLDEMENGKSVANQTQIAKTTKPVTEKTKTYSGAKIYEIQLLANTKLDLVEKRKRDLESRGYKAKILSVVINGTTYYRLRLADSYSKDQADDIGKKVKRDVAFINDFWVVKKSANDRIYTKTSNTQSSRQERPKTIQKEEPKVEKTVVSNGVTQSKIVDYSATCNANEVNIRTGAGTQFEIDPIGKLMQGITVFVVEEQGEWSRFTITPNDESWSGWVRSRYLDKN